MKTSLNDLQSMLENKVSKISSLVSELKLEKETIVILKEEADTWNKQSAEKKTSLLLQLDNLLSSERASFEKNMKALKDEHSKVEKRLQQKFNEASHGLSSKEASLETGAETINEMKIQMKDLSELVNQIQMEKELLRKKSP